MSNLEEVNKKIMSQISSGEIKMKPRWYFLLGSILTVLGLALSITTSVFLIGLMRFVVRANGRMAQYRLSQIINSFPWWIPIVTILSLAFGIWLLHKYDFSYKKDFRAIIAGVVLLAILTGWMIDAIGINDVVFRKGPMRGMMRQYLQQNQINNNLIFNSNES